MFTPAMLWQAKSVQEFRKDRSKCKDDNGERTNTKLHDQPYHQRKRNGKMKGF